MYFFVSTVVFVLSFFLFNRVSPSMNPRKINLISWIFFYFFLIQSFIASILVIYYIDNHYLINRVGFQARFYGWAAIQYAMLATPLGMWLGLVLSGKRSNKKYFCIYSSAPIQNIYTERDSYIRIPLYLLTFLSLSSVFYVFLCLGKFPLLSIFSGGDSFMLAMLRQSAKREFSGNEYVRNLFAITLTPILSYVAYCYWKKTNDSRDLIWFIVLFLASAIILTYDLAKGPIIGYVLGFLFLKVLISGAISKRTILSYFLLVLMLVVLAYILIMKSADIKTLLSYNSGIIGRVFLTQSAGTFLSFELFPSRIDHIGFASVSGLINKVLGVVGSDRSARLIMNEINPAGVQAGIAGVVNSLFIAEAWANFGIVGVLISPIIVGMVVEILFMVLLSVKKTPMALALLAYLPLNIPITGGFNDFFYNPTCLVIFVATLILYFSGQILRGVAKEAKNEKIAIKKV